MRILKHIKHPAYSQIEAEVNLSEISRTNERELFAQILQPILKKQADPQKIKDYEVFIVFESLLSKEGFSTLTGICETFWATMNPAKLKRFFKRFDTPEALAVELFINSSDLFQKARLAYYVHYSVICWQVYEGEICTMKPFDEVGGNNFKRKVLEAVKEHEGAGDQLHIDFYNDDPNVFVMDIRYQSKPRIEEDFKEDGIQAMRIHRPLETALHYEASLGQLKVKTYLNNKALAKALCRIFVCTFLEEPQRFLDTMQERFINLNRLKELESLPLKDYPLFSSVLVTDVRFLPSANSDLTITLHSKKGVIKELSKYASDQPDITINKADFTFRYYENETNKTHLKNYTVQIATYGNKITTPLNNLGNEMNRYFKELGLSCGK